MFLKEWTLKKNISIKEFAKLCDYNPEHIYQYLRGKNRVSKKFAKTVSIVTQGEITEEEILEKNPEIKDTRGYQYVNGCEIPKKEKNTKEKPQIEGIYDILQRDLKKIHKNLDKLSKKNI